MAEPEEAPVPAPEPEKKADEKPEPGLPGFVFMKGGTTSSAYDAEMARRAANAEERRAEQDAMADIGSRGVRPGEAARLGSLRMVNQTTPRAVLFYLNRDGTVRRECVSEVTTIEGQNQGEIDVMFTLVCEKCLSRGIPQGEAQCMVRSSHRKFTIREEPHWVKMGTESLRMGKGSVIKLTDPMSGKPWPVMICGSITCQDRVRCDNYNCDWSVAIEQSLVKDW